MARATRTYGHFCLAARSLELLGDRWSLLVVRDLLVGPRRFTDLMDRLGGITPATLSQRLKELEEHGLVQANREAGRREVWYELTEAGYELTPVLEELFLWGLRHRRQPRRAGERAHPEHLLQALRIVLTRSSVINRPVLWSFDFTDDGGYTLAFDGRTWTLTPNPTPDADVVVTGMSEAWVRHLTTPPSNRPDHPADLQIDGTRAAVNAFARVLALFPDGTSAKRGRRGRRKTGRMAASAPGTTA